MAKAKKTTKAKSVDIDLSELGEQAGLTLLRDAEFSTIYDRLPLFIPAIDRAFGGGLPFGRMVEIAGKNAGGKSTLCFHIARVATALGCIVVLVDVEGTADKVRLAELGIDVSKVLVKQPDETKGVKLTVEEVGRTIESSLAVFKKKFPDVPVVFIWDSVGQTPSEDEMDKDFGDKNVGSRAKAITQFIYKIAPQIGETKSLLIGINQIRSDIGGNPMFKTYSVPGGNAWEHYASLRLEIKAKEAIKKGQDRIGHTMGVKLRKSKVSRPFVEIDSFLISDNGIDYEYNLAKTAENEKMLPVVGMSYEYKDRFGNVHKQKKDNFIEWLRTPEGQPVREELLNRLIVKEFPKGYTPLTNENLDISPWIDKVDPNMFADTPTPVDNQDNSQTVMTEDDLINQIDAEINNGK